MSQKILVQKYTNVYVLLPPINDRKAFMQELWTEIALPVLSVPFAHFYIIGCASIFLITLMCITPYRQNCPLCTFSTERPMCEVRAREVHVASWIWTTLRKVDLSPGPVTRRKGTTKINLSPGPVTRGRWSVKVLLRCSTAENCPAKTRFRTKRLKIAVLNRTVEKWAIFDDGCGHLLMLHLGLL